MHLLVVDDEPRFTRLLRQALEDAQHDVAEAHDGETGEDLARTGAYDAMLLDVTMPGRSGTVVCQNLRRAGITIPIILLSGHTSLADRLAGLDAGADDYLTKPVATAELLARLRAISRRRPTTARLQLADLTVDPLRREVTRGGTLIHLSPREYRLLAFLLHHVGQVFTREQLLVNIWPDTPAHMLATVDTYIHYLRDKIDQGHTPRLLHTIRGAGYVLRAS